MFQCLEIIDAERKLKQFDGLTWLTLTLILRPIYPIAWEKRLISLF